MNHRTPRMDEECCAPQNNRQERRIDVPRRKDGVQPFFARAIGMSKNIENTKKILGLKR